ncbi:HNH endonuclease [Petropleomorpha daqingensis]|uniref:HNH nuclease domain-containing protein n=1 Tax=Petropleomorpha daqingensis TaxID=2026353 RepID=A0A853CG49_9ACTN|nr:HNH endonuclease signature motif containing protein [Petropleomorpha daqingensis]NYJ05063.1 hypothetical protein [Petropleomorpha daqingensis]
MCSDDELHALSGPALLDRTRDLVAERNRIDADLARTVRVADSKQAFAGDGMKSAKSWLKGHCRLAPGAAAQVVRNGRALELLPAVAAAHAAGAITAEQVTEIGKIVAPKAVALAAAQGVDLAETARILTRLAATAPHEDLTKAVHTFLAMLDTDGPEPDPTEQRTLTFTRHADGSITGRFHLDPAGAEKVQAALEAHRQTDRPAGDERTLGQHHADAWVQWADNTLAAGTAPLLRRSKPQVAVNVDLQDLLDPATGQGVAATGFGAVISAARARWLACDADITRIVLGPHGEPLDLGRTHRLVTPALRRAVIARDRTCVFAGCGAPHWWSEVHHLIHWTQGGETSLANSGLLCERHHTQVHHGFRVERDTAGRWHTYRPDGTEILTVRTAPAGDGELVSAS